MLAIIGVSVCSVCIYAGTVSAEKKYSSNEYNYDQTNYNGSSSSSGLEYKVTGINSNGSYNIMLTSFQTIESKVEIPVSLSIGGKNYYITSLGDDLFNNNQNIVSVSFPLAVKSLGKRTFYNCQNLCSVTGFNCIEAIGESCFENCTKLDNIVLSGTTFSDLPENCFAGCTNLQKIKIHSYSPISIGNGAFKNCQNLSDMTFSNNAANILSIGDYAFYNCSKLANFTIPDSIDSIGTAAFSGCIMLDEITIPSSVTEISESAFSRCQSISRLTLPENTTKIGSSAFAECSKLKAISIPESVSEMGSNAFDGCTQLSHIHISKSKSILDYIGKGSLPNNVTFYYTVDQNGECSMGDTCPMISDGSDPSIIPDTTTDKTVIMGMPAVIEADSSGNVYIWQIKYENNWDTLDCQDRIITINDLTQDCVVRCMICADDGSIIESLTVNITVVSVNDVTTDMVEAMNIEECIDLVNMYCNIVYDDENNSYLFLTDAMELAVKRVLDFDWSK